MKLWKKLSLCAALPLSAVLLMSPVRAADAPPAAADTGVPGNRVPADGEKVTWPQGILFPYWILDRTLWQKVDTLGHVNYVELRKDKMLDFFIDAVATADLSQFPVLPKKITVKDKIGRDEVKTVEDHSAELAFWINAHNAYVLKAIATAYPVGSPDDIKDFQTAKRVVGGKDYTLAEMRKKALAIDPRAFFALTDGTASGPMLRQTAYRLTGLDNALDEMTQWYISNPQLVSLLMLDKKVTVPPKLQEADALFRPEIGRQKWAGILKLLQDYSTVSANQRFYINTPEVEITFFRPDRSLNRDPNAARITG